MSPANKDKPQIHRSWSGHYPSGPHRLSDMTSPLRTRLFDLASALTTPLVPTDYLDLVAPLANPTALRGKVVAVRPETRDAATLAPDSSSM